MLSPSSKPPSPAPSALHVVLDGGSPVWLAPLLTGTFVLIAALITAGIAFLSVRASDRRKLSREDRRQWDNELKRAYLAINAEVRDVRIHLSRIHPGEQVAPPGLVVVLERAMANVSKETALLEIFAPAEVVDASKAVGATLASIWQKGFLQLGEDEPSMSWAFDGFIKIDAPVDHLRDCVRTALRV